MYRDPFGELSIGERRRISKSRFREVRRNGLRERKRSARAKGVVAVTAAPLAGSLETVRPAFSPTESTVVFMASFPPKG